jgi:hypothetical protein
MLLELEPAVAAQLDFEMRVDVDPDDAERGLVQLISVSSSELQVEDVSCFAEAIDELVLPPPLDPEGYSLVYPIHLTPE